MTTLPARTRRAPIGRILLALYALLLVASTVARFTRPEPAPAPRFAERTVLVAEYSDDLPTRRQISLSYLDYDPGIAGAPVVVLLHGSPGSAGNFQRLAPLLTGVCPPPDRRTAEGFDRGPIACPATTPANAVRVIAPDLPGFERSTHAIADYSFRAHAHYLRDLLTRLNIPRAHVVGYSMGGGPAFNLEDIAPDKVASITLLSSLGVQEFELTGDYHLNHAIHGVQLGFFWAVENLVPHFGAFDQLPGVEFSRNFFESDQRPLRGFMLRYQKPLLIIQGRLDGQVPPEAALEHHRIVPHSELLMFEQGGHGMVFGNSDWLAPPLLSFVERVERGAAPVRAAAAPARIADAARPVEMAKMIGIATFSAALLIAVAGLFCPELGVALAGVLLFHQRLDPAPALIAVLAGVALGQLVVARGRPWLGFALLRSLLPRGVIGWLLRVLIITLAGTGVAWLLAAPVALLALPLAGSAAIVTLLLLAAQLPGMARVQSRPLA